MPPPLLLPNLLSSLSVLSVICWLGPPLSLLLKNSAASFSSSHQSNVPVDVELRSGRIRGFESIFLHKRVRSFLGVPFAEPPLGELRFRPPQAKRPWNGTVEATALSLACYQSRDTYNESFWGSEMWNANTQISEDCLYMNIWAPAEAKNLTVMVWFFGGGFYYGSPSLILYDGRALALTAGVVVVNINYRLGPFGYLFLDDDEVPGNMGMLDQQLALLWIRDNIEAFGGNPKAVSIFGESAGASSIVAHLIAPGSRGLFQNGILQSGSLDNKWSMDTPKRALEKSMELLRLVGCNRTISLRESIRCLRRISPAELIEQLWNISLGFLEFPLVIVSKDSNFFTQEDAFIALRTKKFVQDVNLMIGINHDEGTFWNIYNIPKLFDVPEQPRITMADFSECVNTAFVRSPEVIREAASHVYLGNRCDYVNGQHRFLADQVNQMVGDSFFTCDSLWLADQLDDSPARIYIYYFDEASSANPWPKWTGVMHAYEIEFVFGVPLYNLTAGYTRREQILSRKMIQLWSSFAATGIPSLNHDHGDGFYDRLHWPQYHSQNNPRWLHIKASHFRPMHATKRAECRVWRAARDMEYNEYVIEKLSAALSAAGRTAAQPALLLLSLSTSGLIVLLESVALAMSRFSSPDRPILYHL